jgi:uncharacterized surface protein with fasciclin (FAS1) repeats
MKQIIRGAGAFGLAIALAACGSAPASPGAGSTSGTTSGADSAATAPATGADTSATSASGSGDMMATSPSGSTGADTSATSASGSTGTDSAATAPATGADTSATSASGSGSTSATTTSGSAGTSATTTSGSAGTSATTTSGSATGTTDSVLGAAASDPRFSTLAGLLETSGLSTQLEALGPFTLFAPTNEAFAALPAGTLESLAQNPSLLQQILLYHVAEGAISSEEITSATAPTTATTAEGQELQIGVNDGTVTVNGTAEVIDTDIEAGQGVIHVIDEVLLPPGVALGS